MYRTKCLREEIAELVAENDGILDSAASTLTDEQRTKFDANAKLVDSKNAELLTLEQEEDSLMENATQNSTFNRIQSRTLATIQQGNLDDDDSTVRNVNRRQSATAEWKDQDGKPVYMLAKGQNWSDLPKAKSTLEPNVGIGDLIKGAICGWSKVSPGIRAAMGEGANTTGGILVPDELLRRVVDKARAASVIARAGAQTVPMTSETLRLARIASDVTFEHKNENEAFTGSDMTFDSVTFSSHTVGTIITASRELAEDAPNFSSIVEDALVAAFAEKLDNIAINGFDSTHLDGILDWPSGTGKIGETGSIGSILWEDLHAAVVALQLLNYQPNAYILNPDIAGDLAILTTGDGINSSKGWLPPPPTVAPLAQLGTTNISTASIIVGDFTHLVWGIRHGAILETTREADNAFSKHQYKVKLVWRGDIQATRRDAFHRLVGVTT